MKTFMTALTVCVLDDFQGIARERLEAAGLPDNVTLKVSQLHLTGDDLLDFLAPANVVVAMRERTPLPRDFLEKLPHLQLVITTGMANTVIDAPDRVAFSGTRIHPHPVVELTWALILGLTKNLVRENRNITTGQWQTTVGRSLHGSTLGLVGVGRAGSAIARVARELGMTVNGWSPNLTPERAAEAGVTFVSREEIFATSTIVSLHLRLGPTTEGLITRADIARMAPDSFFINTSRAELVDHAALVDALRNGRIAGAGLDVFPEEPTTDAQKDLVTMDNVLATPHIGFVTEDNYDMFFDDIADIIRGWHAGEHRRPIGG